MKHNRIRITLLGSLLLISAACSQVAAPALPDETLPQPTAIPLIVDTQSSPDIAPTIQEPEKNGVQMTQPARPSPSSGMEFLVEKAKDDLAQRLSISVNQIDLIEAKTVTWPNASLGCPQPGMVYAEVLTPGYLITLNARDKVYEYHTSKSTEVIFCENPMPPVPGTPDDNI